MMHRQQKSVSVPNQYKFMIEGEKHDMTMVGMRKLFQHELSAMYDAEQRIAQMLPQLENECSDTQVKSALQYHEEETRHQIQNLEECFTILGTEPEQVVCYGVTGLKQEHDSFIQKAQSPEIITAFDLGAASKTEHYEIASYQGLVERATFLGEKECAILLTENLRQEEAMARNVGQLSRQLGQQMMQESPVGA
jgi:ferritin-like metal-binding protein YciE